MQNKIQKRKMKQKNNIGKLLLVIIVVFILFKKVLNIHVIDLAIFIGYTIVFIGIVSLANYMLIDKYFFEVKKYIREKEKNIIIVTALASVINFFIFFVVGTIFKLFDNFVMLKEDYVFFQELGGFRSIFNFSLFLSLLFALYVYVNLSSIIKDQQIEEQKVISGNVSAQFESLKNQLDPHFLFNSLNVLNALIEEDTEKALAFNNSLSKTYRYILDQKNKELVPLQEELDFAKTYIELLQMRFEDSLTFEFPDIVKQEGAKVVPLSLQLLLENVIKHNKASSSKPIHIVITEEANGYLKISNNLNKKQTIDKRKGIGLNNIASRYGLITSKPIKIEETEEFFTVRIPILTKIIEHMRIIDVPENEQEILIEAKKKVEKIKKFYAHLTSYIMVCAFVIMLNLLTDPSFLWCLIIVFAWGIGIVSHAMNTYDYSFFLGKNWEDRKIREHMEKHNGKSQQWD